jgi:N-acetylglucosamine-6-phosphate deacetylase
MYALVNCDIYTGRDVRHDCGVVIEGTKISELVPLSDLHGMEQIDLGGASVSPGFIDLQVNGGDDLLFNDEPTVDAIGRIARAHRKYGTTHFLPTFITGSIEGMKRARAAVENAISSGMSNVLGMHFEGPYINSGKAGVHDSQFIRSDWTDDLAGVFQSIDGGALLVTLAPEVLHSSHISRLASSGVLVAAGHSDATYEEMGEAIRSGVRLGTHLWNAMSPLTSRAPGAVGALMENDDVWVSVIPDGHHVHFGTVGVVVRTKRRGKCFFVTDAMPPVGGSQAVYQLGNLQVKVEHGRCEAEGGVLAGSALDMATAVRNAVQYVGIPKDEALRMASTYPAQFLGMDGRLGFVEEGYEASLAIFDTELNMHGIVLAGELHLHG